MRIETCPKCNTLINISGEPKPNPIYSSKPEVAMRELIDGAYDIVEIWDAKTLALRQWKISWLEKARELGANPD